MLRSDWLSLYYAICYSLVIAHSEKRLIFGGKMIKV